MFPPSAFCSHPYSCISCIVRPFTTFWPYLFHLIVISYGLLLLSHFSHVRLWDPIDGSPTGFPVPGILQARTLGWVAISFSNTWKWKVKVKSHCRVQLLAIAWTAAYQAPPSMGVSRQEYWSGSPVTFSGEVLDISNNDISLRMGFGGKLQFSISPLLQLCSSHENQKLASRRGGDSELGHNSESLSGSVMSNSLWYMDGNLPGPSVSMEFSRQEYWSGLPFPSPGGLPDPGINPGSTTLQADS